MKIIPGDQEERTRAIESPRNLAVTAGAGTGKTTLLVEKLIRKVVDEGVDLTRIQALTFTEKAANEMRERVRVRLAERNAAQGMDRAEIGTIHSFCAHVLRQFPVEAGVAPDFAVDEGGAFRRLFDRAWPRWLDRELGASSRRPRQWREVLEQVDLESLKELAEGLASFSVPEERGDAAGMLRTQVDDAAGTAPPKLAAALRGKGPAPKTGKGSAFRLMKDMQTIDEKIVGRAVALASDFAASFRREYLAAGYVSFEGMLALVYDLLRNPDFPNVLALLREKYEFILLDEFQDTDPVQGEIIRRLAEGPDGRLVPGKLFLVGDPKQSIYAFRGADIVAYQKLADRILGEGGDPVVLRTNFRSHGGILDFVNAVFSGVIRERGFLQPKYEPIEAVEGRTPELPAPHLELVLIENATAQQSREAEAQAIADWIADRPGIKPRDIAILFKALTDVPGYIEALRAKGIPYIVHGEKYFYGTSEVIDFVNLLRAVADPGDSIAVAGVLRSPYGALTDQRLYERRKDLEPRADSDVPILAYIAGWHEVSGKLGVPELFDRIFEECYALEIAGAGYHGEQAVANLLKLRQKAADLQAEGGCTLREFLEVASRAVKELEEEGESPLADEALDAVSILSIHRAKGLEYPVVILPDLHRRSGSRGGRTVRYDWPTRTLGVRLGDVCDSGGAALAYLDGERRLEEEKRLLYVAVTRAREHLLLLGRADYDSNSYLALLYPELEKRASVTVRPYRPFRFRPAEAAPEKEKPDWNAFVEKWKARERRAAGVEPITSPTKLERGDEDAPAPTRAIEVGVACHRVLEHLDFADPKVPAGTDGEAAGILSGFFRSAAFRELAGAEILARELPFVYRRDGRLVEGAIDLVYRRDGKVFAADYKTDKMMRPEEHALIRDIYGEAVRRVFREEAGFKLFYLRHGRGVEI